MFSAILKAPPTAKVPFGVTKKVVIVHPNAFEYDSPNKQNQDSKCIIMNQAYLAS